MVLQLFARLVPHLRVPIEEHIMDHWSATDGSGRGAARRFDVDERVDGARDALVVTLGAVRGGDVLHDDVAEGAGGIRVEAGERHVDAGAFTFIALVSGMALRWSDTQA